MPNPHGGARANAGATPISRGEPVTLPQSCGGVTAVKFRDPEGHPLELLKFPAGSNSSWQGRGMMGIDHSAISIADLAASRRFYEEHGLAEGKRTLNQGPAQVALDGLDGVEVDVLPMNPPDKPPHVELLGYRQPAGRPHALLAANDVAATRIVWSANRDAARSRSRRASPPTHAARSIASRYWVAAIKSRRPSAPPNVQFEATAGVGMKPSLRRSADQMCTPSAALVHTQPRASTAKPSG